MSDGIKQPAWADDLCMTLSATGQFLLTGNIHDQYLLPLETAGKKEWKKFDSLPDALALLLLDQGHDWVAAWDVVDGFRLCGRADRISAEQRSNASKVLGVSVTTEPTGLGRTVEELAAALPLLVDATSAPGALIVDYSSRIGLADGPEGEAERNGLFIVAEKLATEHTVGRRSRPIIWIANQPSDLPPFFVSLTDGVRSISIPRPDRSRRETAAREYFLGGLAPSEKVTVDQAVDSFAKHTAGLTLRAMSDIWRLAKGRGLSMADIEVAARAYRVGVLENPWRDPALRHRIGAAEPVIAAAGEQSGPKVLGQAAAVLKTFDILKRSALGLTAAHTGDHSSRPRGVLFFAGPTGVGKTQLAKAINKIVFDSDDPLRFDMSEFAQEHTEARLIGAPPGYVGYGTGGELTKGIRERPFSVVLFDEIEKAHPRILDKFLQILDEGRLTDGMGQTVFFSEAIIVFTSNLGMFRPVIGEDGRPKVDAEGRPLRVKRTDDGDYDKLVREVKQDIKEVFELELQRPELYNRIGEDNIVVFNFIGPEIGRQIFALSVANVQERVRNQLNVELRIEDMAWHILQNFALSRLDMGGRGIGTAVESCIVNPIARVLFEVAPPPGSEVVVTDAKQDTGGVWNLVTR